MVVGMDAGGDGWFYSKDRRTEIEKALKRARMHVYACVRACVCVCVCGNGYYDSLWALLESLSPRCSQYIYRKLIQLNQVDTHIRTHTHTGSTCTT
jgi:hypothetical protein